MSDLTEEDIFNIKSQDVYNYRKAWFEEIKKAGKVEALSQEYEKCIGLHHGKRHLVTNKEFKPLKDLLSQSSCEITQEFHKLICNTPNVQQFVMSPEMALEVQRLTNSMFKNPQDLMQWIPKIKTPYPRLCVEMPITEEMQGMRLPLEEGMSQVNRIGAYIETYEQDNEIMVTFSPYYEFVSGYVISAHVLLANLNNQILPGFIPIKLHPHEMIWNATFHPAVFKIAHDEKLSVEQFWERMGNNGNILNAIAAEAAEELPSLFFSWLILLNSKSGVTKTNVNPIIPHPKLGKRERARRGRSGYTVVSLTDTENVDAQGLVTLKHVVNAHRVRGHFKARKHGIYWWRPHVRGVGELTEREGYTLTA